jgi:autotransporter-associated beta strand protein
VLTLGGGVTLQGGTAALQGSATIGSATQGITLTGNLNFGAGPGNTLTINSPITGTGNLVKNNNAGDAVIFNQPVSSTLSNFTSDNGTTEFNQGLTLTWDLDQAKLRAASGATVKLAGTSSFRELEISTATVNIGAGATVTYNQLEMSQGGGTQSVINQTGGTVNFTGTNNTNTTSASFLMGHWGSGSASTYNLSGGNLNAAGAVMSLGWDSTNVNFNQSGGTANFLGINLANGRDNTAAYTMTGGRINLGATGITNAGNKSVNLGGGTVGAFADWTTSKPIQFTGTNGDVIIDTLDSVDGTTARTITLNGANTGTGGFSKINAGTLALGSANGTFNGTGRVSGGSLFLAGNAAQNATIIAESGGTLRAGTPTTAGASAINALDLGGGNVTFRVGTSADTISAGSLTVSNPTTISIIPTSALTVSQQFTVMTYGGSIGGLDSAGISLNPIANPHYTAALDFDELGVVKLVVNSADTVTWTGATNGNWDVNSTANWKTDSDDQASNYYDFDAVTFDDDGANPAITLIGTITPASVAVNATQHYTFSGSGISGTTGLTKAGSGTLTLLITGGSVVVGNGGTTGTLGGTGGINVSTGTSLAFNRSDAQTLARSITGGGTLFSNGGDFTLNAANNVVDIVINSGTFFARGGGWATSYAANRTITVNSAATLDTTTHALGGLGGATRPNNIVLNEDAVWKLNNEQQLPNVALTMTAGIVNGPGDARGSGTIVTLAHATKSSVINAPLSTGNGAITFNVADGDVAVDLSVAGNIIGGNAITKSGAGTMVSTGTNTYTGATNITGGVFQVGAGGTTGSLGTGAVTNNASLVIDRSDSLTIANVISGIGSLTKKNANVLTLGAVNTYSGDTIVENGTLSLASSGGLRFVPTTNGTGNKITGSGSVELSGTFTIDLSSADLTDGNSWTLVDVGSLSSAVHLSSFSIAGFTESANVHTLVDGNNTWTYTEGTGVLELDVAGGYTTWATQIPDVNQRGRGDNPDGDAFTNLQEFLFGTDPMASTGSLTSLERSGSDLIIRWRERTSGASYVLQESVTLVNPWATSTAPVTDDGTVDGDYQPKKATAPIGAGKNFFRVEGTELP